MKEVYYHQYCCSCQHLNDSDAEEPCNECLTNYCREDSHKPIHYTEDPTKVVHKE